MDCDKKEIYANLGKRISALSVSFKAVLESGEIRQFFQEQMESRKKISGIFRDHCGEICRQCKGDCCKSCIWLFKKDLLLFISRSGLNFPEPDWDFVNSKNCCIFLSSFGCILKEFRPWQCLKHFCNKFKNIKILQEINSLIYEYELSVNRFAGAIQQKWHLTLD